MGVRQVRFCDHHDGSTLVDAKVTALFEHSGVRYTTDLCPDHLNKYDAAFKPWIEKAMHLGGVKQKSGGKTTSGSGTTLEERVKIREWAGKNGLFAHPRGKIAQDVVDAWRNRKEPAPVNLARPFATADY